MIKIIEKLQTGEPLTEGERIQIMIWLCNYKRLSIVLDNGSMFCYDGIDLYDGITNDEEDEEEYESY